MQELLSALALLLVLEGIVPFISPSLMRRLIAVMAKLDDNNLRISGLLSMIAGVVLLYIVR